MSRYCYCIILQIITRVPGNREIARMTHRSLEVSPLYLFQEKRKIGPRKSQVDRTNCMPINSIDSVMSTVVHAMTLYWLNNRWNNEQICSFQNAIFILDVSHRRHFQRKHSIIRCRNGWTLFLSRRRIRFLRPSRPSNWRKPIRRSWLRK